MDGPDSIKSNRRPVPVPTNFDQRMIISERRHGTGVYDIRLQTDWPLGCIDTQQPFLTSQFPLHLRQ